MTRKFYDGKLYLVFGIVTLALVFIISAISSYSHFVVEPEVRTLLATSENIDENYRKAYIILREPQLFAGYEQFDGDSRRIEKFIESFDELVYSGLGLMPDHKVHLEILLERRVSGTILGYKTAVFVLIISLMSWLMFFLEKRQQRKES